MTLSHRLSIPWLSRKNRALFTHTEQARIDTLGFVEPVSVYAVPRLNHLLSQLRLKLGRLNEAIQAAQQRSAEG